MAHSASVGLLPRKNVQPSHRVLGFPARCSARCRQKDPCRTEDFGLSAIRLAKAEAAFEKRHSVTKEFVGEVLADADSPAESKMTIQAARKVYGPDARLLAQAETLYTKQLERRSHYILKSKGRMSADGTRRYLIREPSGFVQIPILGKKKGRTTKPQL